MRGPRHRRKDCVPQRALFIIIRVSSINKYISLSSPTFSAGIQAGDVRLRRATNPTDNGGETGLSSSDSLAPFPSFVAAPSHGAGFLPASPDAIRSRPYNDGETGLSMSRCSPMPLLFWPASFCLCSCAISWRRVSPAAPGAIRSRPYKDRETGLSVSRCSPMPLLFWPAPFCLCSCAISWRRVSSAAPSPSTSVIGGGRGCNKSEERTLHSLNE